MAVVENVIQVICFIILLRYSKTNPCSTEVCFTWKVSINELTLICKINNLRLRVLIGDQFGNTQADCLPPTSFSMCEPYYHNGTIIQNRRTNETIYIVKGHIDRHINGNWTCRHGTRRDVARVEVTVLKENHIDNHPKIEFKNTTCNEKEQDFVCLKNTTFWTVITLLASISISLITLSCLKNNPRIIDDLFVERFNCCRSISKTIPGSRSLLVCKKICFAISIALFIGFSILISWLDDKSCTSQWVFIVLGSIFGIVITILFLNREDKDDKNTTSVHLSLSTVVQEQCVRLTDRFETESINSIEDKHMEGNVVYLQEHTEEVSTVEELLTEESSL